jgi:hypothetical protein
MRDEMTIQLTLQFLGIFLILTELLCVFYAFPFLEKGNNKIRWILGLWLSGTFFLFSFLWYPLLFG